MQKCQNLEDTEAISTRAVKKLSEKQRLIKEQAQLIKEKEKESKAILETVENLKEKSPSVIPSATPSAVPSTFPSKNPRFLPTLVPSSIPYGGGEVVVVGCRGCFRHLLFLPRRIFSVNGVVVVPPFPSLPLLLSLLPSSSSSFPILRPSPPRPCTYSSSSLTHPVYILLISRAHPCID